MAVMPGAGEFRRLKATERGDDTAGNLESARELRLVA